MKLRLTSSGLVDIDFDGTRLTSGGLVQGSQTSSGPSAALSGTVTGSITESDVIAGNKTIILTLTGDTWVTSGTTFDAQRQNIINGLVSAQSESAGWNNEVKANLAVTTVVRTSNTVTTITLSAQSSYNITAQETITVTIPATALVTSTSAIEASPTFTVDFISVGVFTGNIFYKTLLSGAEL